MNLNLKELGLEVNRISESTIICKKRNVEVSQFCKRNESYQFYDIFVVKIWILKKIEEKSVQLVRGSFVPK